MILHTQLLLVLLALSVITHGQKLKDSIYTDIEEIRPCLRRLNGTAEIGCTSSIGGNVGVVLYIKDVADVSKLSDDAFAPYILADFPPWLRVGIICTAMI